MKRRKMGRVAPPPVMACQGVKVNEFSHPSISAIIGGMGQEEEEMRTTLPEEKKFKLTLPLMLGIGAGLFLGYKFLKG